MNSFVPSAAVMTAIPTKLMKLIFPPMAPETIMFIVIAEIVTEALNNVTNLSMKSLKNGVDDKCVCGIVN